MHKSTARASAAILGLSAGALLVATPALAVPLLPGLSVTGSVDYLAVTPATEVGAPSNSGTAEIVQGGLLSTTGISGVTQTIDPFTHGGLLTDIGDGVGLVTTSTLGSPAAPAAVGDRFDYNSVLSLTVMNTSGAAIDFRIILDVDVSADANGPDTAVDWDLHLEDVTPAPDASLALLQVISDTNLLTAGDQIDEFLNGSAVDTEPDPGTFGGLVSHTELYTFPFTLAAGATQDFEVQADWFARIFPGGPGDAIVTQDIFLSIETDPLPPDPMGIPAPASLPLLASGLLGLAYLTGRRRLTARGTES